MNHIIDLRKVKWLKIYLLSLLLLDKLFFFLLFVSSFNTHTPRPPPLFTICCEIWLKLFKVYIVIVWHLRIKLCFFYPLKYVSEVGEWFEDCLKSTKKEERKLIKSLLRAILSSLTSLFHPRSIHDDDWNQLYNFLPLFVYTSNLSVLFE